MSFVDAQLSLNKLLKSLKVDTFTLIPGETHSVFLQDKEPLFIRYDKGLGMIFLKMTILTEFPYDEALKIELYERILETQLLFGELQIGRVGFDKKSNSLVLQAGFLLDDLSKGRDLFHYFPIFMEMVLAWKSILSS